MTNPNEKYGFGPRTRDGREVVITGTTKDVSYPVRGRIGEEVRTWAKCGREFLDQKSDTDLIPLSESATCNESLQVQNVSQEDLDSLLGLRKEEANTPTGIDLVDREMLVKAHAEIEKLQAELEARVDLIAKTSWHVMMRTQHAYTEAQATIAHQQAMLIALVECKDALLAELKSQRASYPAKATPDITEELAKAIYGVLHCSIGLKPAWEEGGNAFKQDEARTLARTALTALNASLAVAPKNDRDEHFDREWYLLGGEIERLQEERDELTRLLEAHRGHATEKVKQAEAERDELKRQLDKYRALTPYADDLEHREQQPFTQEMIYAGLVRRRLKLKGSTKCPPDAVLAALDWWATSGDSDPLTASWNDWQSSKTAPKEGE